MDRRTFLKMIGGVAAGGVALGGVAGGGTKAGDSSDGDPVFVMAVWERHPLCQWERFDLIGFAPVEACDLARPWRIGYDIPLMSGSGKLRSYQVTSYTHLGPLPPRRFRPFAVEYVRGTASQFKGPLINNFAL